MSEVMLLFPNTGILKKKRSIFNHLSAISSIISVNKLENKDIKILYDVLKNINVSDEVIPEVYDVQVEH